MTLPNATLGTLLRALLDRLDPEVEAAYRAAGLDFRPRFTPVLRALDKHGPQRIKDIAAASGLSHSAVSQTVSALQARNWVRLVPGKDSRERFVHPTRACQAKLPALRKQWARTARAAASLDADLGQSLEDVLRQALRALQTRSFGERMDDPPAP